MRKTQGFFSVRWNLSGKLYTDFVSLHNWQALLDGGLFVRGVRFA